MELERFCADMAQAPLQPGATFRDISDSRDSLRKMRENGTALRTSRDGGGGLSLILSLTVRPAGPVGKFRSYRSSSSVLVRTAGPNMSTC
jgi:hypothetical protein